ncbi:MAG: PilN domain-containing protein [Burkholderiales bacterium]
MRRIDLDYRRRGRAAMGPGALLLVLGLVLSISLFVYRQELNNRIAHWEDEVGKLERFSQRRLGVVSHTSLQTAGSEGEVRQIRNAFQQLTLPWDGLFAAIEASVDDSVALLALVPDAAKHQVKIEGEAKDLDAVMAYIRRLEHDASLAGVYLSSHEVKQQDAQKPVHFSLTALWTLPQ